MRQHAWFVAFADDPAIAVAVFVQDAGVDGSGSPGVAMLPDPLSSDRVDAMNEQHVPRRAKIDPDATREDAMTDQPRILGGRYQIGQIIGRGGMALVSKARDLRLGRDVAVKELRIDLAGESDVPGALPSRGSGRRGA